MNNNYQILEELIKELKDSKPIPKISIKLDLLLPSILIGVPVLIIFVYVFFMGSDQKWVITISLLFFALLSSIVIGLRYHQRKLLLTSDYLIHSNNVYPWSSIKNIYEIVLKPDNARVAIQRALLFKLKNDNEFIVKITDLNMDSTKLVNTIKEYWSCD